MKLLVQRVTGASVEIDGKVYGKIGKGFLVLLGACESDDEKVADKMIKKLVGLRIFEDSEGKTNLALADVAGEVLVVSQFTLYADCRHGNRPSFLGSGSPEHANKIYDYAVKQLREVYKIATQTGEFGADMKVSLVNDGPFTIMLDSAEICK